MVTNDKIYLQLRENIWEILKHFLDLRKTFRMKRDASSVGEILKTDLLVCKSAVAPKRFGN